MSWRNIESFTALVHIALTDGSGLGQSWGQVLKCLSEFQRLHMIGTGAKTDASLFFPARSEGRGGSSVVSAKSSGRAASSTRMSVILQPARPRMSQGGTRDSEIAAVDEHNSSALIDKVDVVAI